MNLMKLTVSSLMAAALLVGCGGGGKDAGTSAFGSNSGSGGSVTDPTAATATAVDVLSSLPQLGTGGTEEATITVVVKGAGSVVLASAPVTLVASSGVLAVDSTTTNSSGVVTARLTSGSQSIDKTNRTITVTATSGTATGSVNVLVAGTTAAYSGATSLSQSSSATPLAVLVKDSKGVSIAGATVTVSASARGNGLASNTATTDSNGAATFNYTPTNPGADTLTFSVLGATTTANLSVSGEDFSFISPATGTETAVGTPVTVTVRYRQGLVPQAGRTIAFSSTAGAVGTPSAVTDSTGQASTTVTSNFAGSALVTANIASVGATTTLPLGFVATTPANLVLQVTPSAISPNIAPSIAQQATVLARVTDSNGNPVKGQSVSFSRTADPSNGNLSAGTVNTDANGEASVKYISGPNPTSSGGVVLKGQVGSVVGTTSLTVSQSALFIALGTGNEITNSDTSTYEKKWTVYVTDSNGVAVPNVTLTMSLLPVAYGKGQLAFSGRWDYPTVVTAQSSTASLAAGEVMWCPSEDTDKDGFLDSGEDLNTSGSLEPGNVISLASGSGTVVTGSTGQATVTLRYAESYVPWVQVTLRAAATVSGTESKKDATFVVSGSAGDFNNADTPPAGRVSPFGVRASCSIAN